MNHPRRQKWRLYYVVPENTRRAARLNAASGADPRGGEAISAAKLPVFE